MYGTIQLSEVLFNSHISSLSKAKASLARVGKPSFNTTAWRQTLQLHQQMQNECLEDIYPKPQIKTAQVADYMRRCLQAEAYEEGIIGYRHYCGDSMPTSRNLHTSERNLGYAYCLHYAEDRYSADDYEIGRASCRERV